MDDKERTLKALEDMKESMAYAVRRRATADVVTLEAQVLALQTQLERVERETITKCAAEVQRYMDELSPQTSERHDGAFVCLTRLQKSIRALPSAKTAQTEQQKG